MLLDIGFLDDATRPAPIRLEGVTPEQKLPGQHLKEIHDHLRHNMLVLGKLIERAAAGEASPEDVARETEQLEIITNYRRFGNLCGQYCQIVHTHHSIEDAVIFPAIAEQGEAFKKIAERLVAEHVVVHELIMRLVDALNALARDPGKSRFDDTVEIYQALEKVLLSHLGYEEEAIGDALGYFGIGV